VVELVGEHRATAPGKRGDEAEVREVPGAEMQRARQPDKSCKPRLERFMRFGVAADQRRGAGSDAVALGPAARRLDERRMVRKTEVVVAAEREVAVAIDQEVRPVRALDRAATPRQPGACQLVEARGEIGHGGSLG
jgi:hypothetical protein